MKTKSVIAVLLLLCFALRAQNVKQATWLATLGETVKNVYSTQLNVPLVETTANSRASLVALEPSTGAVLWKSSLGSSIKEINALEGTPFSILELAYPDRTILLNVGDGKMIDISKEVQGKINSYHLVPESYDLVFYSKDPDYFLVIDLYAFTIRWNGRADFSTKAPSTISKLSKFGLLPSSPMKDITVTMECPPISNRSGGLIFAGSGKLYNVDATGKLIWQIDQPKKKKGGFIKTVDNQTELLVDETLDQFYILKSKNMMAVKTSDGSQAWPDFYEVKGNTIVDTEHGLMPMTIYAETAPGQGGGMFNKSKLNLVEESSGKSIWPAELELKGFVDKYRMLDDHTMAVVTFNQTNSRFQIIDLAQGKFRYADEVQLKGRVLDFIVGSEKILFATSKGLDMIEAATGRDLLPKMQRFDNDADILSVYKGVMAYNIDAKNHKVYRTDLTKGVSEEIVKNFKFEVGEPLVKYDVLDNGNIFMASAHHMKVYSPTGELVKDQPFDYSGRGMDKFNNVMAKADQVTNTIDMAISLAGSAVVLGIGELTGTTKEAIETSNELVAPELAIHNLAKNARAAQYYIGLKRMKKDVSTPGSFFVRRNKDAKADYLSYVSKSDGTVIFDIPLAADSDEPEFTIDETNGFLFYAPRFNKANIDWVFATEKEKEAGRKTREGIVAGYQF